MRIPLVAVAILALAGACGGGTPSATSTPRAAPTIGGAATAGASVPAGVGDPSQISCNDGGAGTAAEIFDNGFRPDPVSADADRTVTWTNTGTRTHTVTFDNGPDCSSLEGTETLSVLFPGPGSYTYHCTIHGSMRGTVTVQ